MLELLFCQCFQLHFRVVYEFLVHADVVCHVFDRRELYQLAVRCVAVVDERALYLQLGVLVVIDGELAVARERLLEVLVRALVHGLSLCDVVLLEGLEVRG